MATFEDHAKQIMEFGGMLVLGQPSDIRIEITTIQMNIKQARRLSSAVDLTDGAAGILWDMAQDEELKAAGYQAQGSPFSAYKHYQAALALYNTVCIMGGGPNK